MWYANFLVLKYFIWYYENQFVGLVPNYFNMLTFIAEIRMSKYHKHEFD